MADYRPTYRLFQRTGTAPTSWRALCRYGSLTAAQSASGVEAWSVPARGQPWFSADGGWMIDMILVYEEED